MLLAAHKTAHVAIVIQKHADPAEAYAAEELQRYIDRIALARPAVRTDWEDLPEHAILVGRSMHVPASSIPKDLAGEQYILKTVGRHLLVVGGTPRGTLYAVYDLLERLGVRWWTPSEETVPSTLLLEVPGLNVRVNPPLIYRATWYREAMDADFQARMRLDAGTMAPVHLQPRHGGMERFAIDWSGHTYSGLVPVDKYFDKHPEYFSEVNGVRLRHMNQLCPTHPAVAEIAAATAAQWLAATPGCRLVSVTQNDHNNWCTCKTCAAMIEKTGTPSGPTLHLANEVARRLEKSHPRALVDTFAYAWTESAPRGMRAHPNVLVRLAPIGNCFGHTIRSCPANAGCRAALRDWSRIARHLFVWHYVTDFFHYMTPFPNLPPLEDDIHTYLEHKVRGMFMQGNGSSLGGDMAELKVWLIARLLWNPSLRARDVRAEFLQGYYGPAADAVADYLALFEKTFAQSRKEHLFLYRTLWDNTAAYLAKPVLKKAHAILEAARRAASGDGAVSRRLARIQSGLDYTDVFYHERPGRRVLRGSTLVCPSSPRRRKLVDRFFAASRANRFTHYGEDYGRWTTLRQLEQAWRDSAGTHPVVRLANRRSTALLVPDLGGRVVLFGPADGTANYLGVSSPRTFGYPCAGGYEEYSDKNHQSPGFSDRFRVVRKSGHSVTLAATLETGAVLTRRVNLRGDGALEIRTDASNPLDAPAQLCLRAHLEIDLATPPEQLETWFLRDGRWERQNFGGKAPGGAFHDERAPEGWCFWSPAARRGVWHRWSRKEVGTVYLGTIPGEATVLALDLARGRYNTPVNPGKSQVLHHTFGWTTSPEVRG